MFDGRGVTDGTELVELSGGGKMFGGHEFIQTGGSVCIWKNEKRDKKCCLSVYSIAYLFNVFIMCIYFKNVLAVVFPLTPVNF